MRTDVIHRMERRAGERVEACGGAMAAFRDEDGALVLTRVELVDRSVGGLGVRCPVPVPPGRRFAIYSPPPGAPSVTGVVARCEAEGEEFRVGLRCDARLAA